MSTIIGVSSSILNQIFSRMLQQKTGSDLFIQWFSIFCYIVQVFTLLLQWIGRYCKKRGNIIDNWHQILHRQGEEGEFCRWWRQWWWGAGGSWWNQDWLPQLLFKNKVIIEEIFKKKCFLFHCFRWVGCSVEWNEGQPYV